MGSSLLQLAWRQLAASKGLVAVMALGIVVAATLLASAPIYARSMADLGLTYVIRSELKGNANSRIEFNHVPLQTAEGVALRNAVTTRIDERIGWFREAQYMSMRFGRFGIAKGGELPAIKPPQAEPQSIEGYESRVELVEGALPKRTNDGVLEFAMSQRAAQSAGLAIGDTFDMVRSYDNCEREIPTEPFPPPPPPCPITTTVEFTVPARLVGIVEPLDPDDPYWVGASGKYFTPYQLQIVNVGPISPMFGAPDALLEDFGKRYPGYEANFGWQVVANAERLNRGNFQRARDDLISLYSEFEPIGGFAISPLRETLLRFDQSADYQQIPLTVLLLEITGIAIFYVILVAIIVVERQAAEIALLRGRGATIYQLVMVYVVQGLVLGIPTLIAAPFLAAAMTALLGLTPIFSDISGNDLLPVTIVPLSFGLAAIGIVLSMLALVAPALAAALRGATATRRSFSRPGWSFIQKYYLDVGLAAAAILLLIELRERGSIFTPSSTGGVSTDPLLLASPALAILAAGALILRFYPLVLRIAAKAAGAVAGPAIALGLWQVVRNPGQYTRLALLLMMAVAVGTFAASYTETADRSYLDRANYQAGVDLRAGGDSSTPIYTTERDMLEASASKLDGVQRASALVRTTAQPGAAGSTLSEFQVLAVDPKAAGEMLWTRDDFAGQPLPDLLSLIDGQPAPPGKPLPADATGISAWVRSTDSLIGLTLRVGLRDARGQFGLLEVAGLDDVQTDWVRVSGPIDRNKLPFEPVAPLSLVSVTITGVSTRPIAPTLFVDDIGAVTPAGDTVVESFDGPPQWTMFPSTATSPDQFGVTNEGPHSGSGVAKYQFRQGNSQETRGFYLSGFLTPLPAIVSESFANAIGAKVGGQTLLKVGGGTLVPVEIRGMFRLFPTTRTSDGPVVIFNRDRFVSWAQIAYSGYGQVPEPNEVWLDLKPGANNDELVSILTGPRFAFPNYETRARSIASNTENPLIAASGTGILYAAFFAILALVAAALITSLLAAIRRRRVEIAVVRAIGLTRAQLLSMLTLEYAIVFVVGIAAGCGLGLFVSDRMLSFLEVTESGDRVEPPFILETQWLLVALGVVVVLAVFATALWLTARIVGRTSDAAALRADN